MCVLTSGLDQMAFSRWPMQAAATDRARMEEPKYWKEQVDENSVSLKSKLFDHLMKRKDESSDLWWELGEEKGSETKNPLATKKQSRQKTNPAERRKTLISDFKSQWKHFCRDFELPVQCVHVGLRWVRLVVTVESCLETFETWLISISLESQ